MRLETPDAGRALHRPEQSAAGVYVFAFDRDFTVDVNPPSPDRYLKIPDGQEQLAVPLDWVAHLAHNTDHIVYATGNQTLKKEASIPGTGEIIDAHPDQDLEEVKEASFSDRPSREERVQMLGDLYPEADELIVVDDVDLSDLEDWTHYFSWDFMVAAEQGTVVPELPPADDADDLADFLAPQENRAPTSS